MSGVNMAVIVGRLGADPETKTFDDGRSVTNFSVATSESWTDKTTGEKKEATEWHRISCYGKLAEICAKYLTKGRTVFVEGKIKTRTYEKDGVKHYATDIIADKVEFIGQAKTADEETAKAATPAKATTPTPDRTKLKNHAPTMDDAENLPF